MGLASAWWSVSNAFASTDTEPSVLHERRRSLLRESVQRVVRP